MKSVITVDEFDRVTGRADKMVAHKHNIRHRAFSVFCLNSSSELLLQQRAYTKYHSPGLWTNTCCSHPVNEGDIDDEIHERLKFEMGFDTEVEYIFTVPYTADLGDGLYENEIDRIYTGIFNGTPVPNPEEAEAYKWIHIDSLSGMISETPKDFTAWFRILYPVFYEYHNGILQKQK